jgi:Soluble lytic murein transglycosylase and related regulatory proteins (some contain LysM/invasin domains)
MRPLISISLAVTAAIGVWLLLRKKTPQGEVTVSDVVDGVLIEEPIIEVSEPSLDEDSIETESLWDTLVNSAYDVSNWVHPRGEQYKPLFTAVESKYGIPNGLLFRQAYQESRFRDDIINGDVRSSAGAVGIMQIVPRWHPDLGEAGALDVSRAVDYAGKLLSGWHKQFKSWKLALAAYNAGPGNVIKYGGIPPFSETQTYVAQITNDVQVSA